MTNEKLFELYSNGDDKAKEQLIVNNINLVKYIANKYYTMFEVCNYKDYDFEDLVQVGIIGLMKAIDKYNPALGCKFSTYAVNWIKQTIRRALEGHEDTLSLEENIGDDEDSDLTLMDTIEDKSINFVEELEIKELKRLWGILGQSLNEEEIRFLKIKYNNNLNDKQVFEVMQLDEREGRILRERALRKARAKMRYFKKQFEDYIDFRTTYIAAIDYSRPKVNTGYYSSIVESIVLERERLRERFEVKGIDFK